MHRTLSEEGSLRLDCTLENFHWKSRKYSPRGLFRVCWNSLKKKKSMEFFPLRSLTPIRRSVFVSSACEELRRNHYSLDRKVAEKMTAFPDGTSVVHVFAVQITRESRSNVREVESDGMNIATNSNEDLYSYSTREHMAIILEGSSCGKHYLVMTVREVLQEVNMTIGVMERGRVRVRLLW